MPLAKNTVYTILFALLALVILWFAYKKGYFFPTRETFEADPETGYDKKMHVLTMFSTHLARKPTEDEYKRYLSIPGSDDKLLEKFKKEYAAEIAKPPALSKDDDKDADEDDDDEAPVKAPKKAQKVESMEQQTSTPASTPTPPPPASSPAVAGSGTGAAAGAVAPKIDTTPALTPAQLQQLQAEKSSIESFKSSIESFQASAPPEPFQPGYSGLSFGSIPDDKVCVNRFTVSSMLNKMSEELRQLKEIMSMQ